MTGTWWGDLLVSCAVAVLLLWVALLATMAVVRPRGASLKEALRLLPDVLRLIHRLAKGGSLPRGVRIKLTLLLVYLASPIDLVPDVVPVLGYADDAIVVVAVLRGVVRRVGPAALRAHWPGSDEGFGVLCRLAGLHPNQCM